MEDFSYYIEQKVGVVLIRGKVIMHTIDQINKDLEPLIKDVKTGTLNGIIIDFKHVEDIDSAGFGAICGKFLSLKKIGKKLCVVHLSKNVQNFFDKLELSKAFYTNKSLPVLIESMGQRFEKSMSRSNDSWSPVMDADQPQEKSLRDFVEN